MAKEIERKFLMKNNEWRGLVKPTRYCQAYLNDKNGPTVRIRVQGEKAFLTLKGPTKNGSRLEYEYEVPLEDGMEIIENLATSPVVEKYRYAIPYRGFIWEVDEFLGENSGLIFAEIELTKVDQEFEKPSWIGNEVTDDPRFYNSNLAANPFSQWPDREYFLTD